MSPTTNVPPSTASQKRLFESQILLAQHGVLLHQRHQTRCQLTRGALLLVVVAQHLDVHGAHVAVCLQTERQQCIICDGC